MTVKIPPVSTTAGGVAVTVFVFGSATGDVFIEARESSTAADHQMRYAHSDSSFQDNSHHPNRTMLEALNRISRIQAGMQPRTGGDSLSYLREAREGGMYGLCPNS